MCQCAGPKLHLANCNIRNWVGLIVGTGLMQLNKEGEGTDGTLSRNSGER
jgi:hypothetical protein